MYNIIFWMRIEWSIKEEFSLDIKYIFVRYKNYVCVIENGYLICNFFIKAQYNIYIFDIKW
jgi:hypothetical protein